MSHTTDITKKWMLRCSLGRKKLNKPIIAKNIKSYYSLFQAGDEERLKQLNDEQLLRLLEEAYHSKKLDDKNKSSLFKVSYPMQHPCLIITTCYFML